MKVYLQFLHFYRLYIIFDIFTDLYGGVLLKAHIYGENA